MSQQSFVPVILGSNKGSYSIARAFHEAYSIKSEMILKMDLGATAYSTIMNKHLYPDLLNDFPAAAEQFKGRIDRLYPQVPKIIIGSDDWFVEQLIRHRSMFEGDWVVPYVDFPTLERAVDKSSFYQICASNDIPHPHTYDIDRDLDRLDSDQPYVVKAANSSTYQNFDFEGKKKAFLCENKQQAADAISLIQEAGYDDDIVLQDYLKLEATNQASITAYRSPHDHELKMVCFGRVMVEDPMPDALGNNLVILTEAMSDELFHHTLRLMEELEWVGYANFDLIHDGKHFNFLEINPRLGMTNYYATAAGFNVARYYVEDFIYHDKEGLDIEGKQILFNSIPKFLTKAMVGHTPYWPAVLQCYQKSEVYNALVYQPDKHWRRQVYTTLNKYNYVKKFKSVGKI